MCPYSSGLQGPDLETWRSYLVATRLLFDEIDQRLQEKAEITLADFGLLSRLAEAGEIGLRMSELADSTVFSRSRISHAVTRLEEQGWIQRRACPTDRRGSFAAITEQGREKVRQAEPVHAQVVQAHLLSVLGEEEAERFRERMTAISTSLSRRR